MKRWFLIAAIAAAVLAIALGIGLVGGVLLDRQVLSGFFPLDNIPADARPSFKLMAEVWNTIQQSYVDRPAVVSETLTYGAIRGMVDSLGDTGHSRFLSPEMVKLEAEQLAGSFEGVGAYVEMRDGQVTIVSPIDGSPAQAAGLKAGDIILKVDGQATAGLTLDEAASRIKGPAGTQVTLTIRDPVSGTTRDVTLTRAHIKEVRVTWARLPGSDVALVRLVSFGQGATDDLQKALAEIQQQGLGATILDLRNNPGGYLGEAVGVASQFLRSGNVLLQKNADGQITPMPVREGVSAVDLPLVVLINHGTASAAEIVSGALQDAQRAQLVGETTLGTGTVLSTIPLSDGSALMLATQEWLTPSGRVIWHKGIEPDVPVALPETGVVLSPDQAGAMSPAELASSGDSQLLEALRLLVESAGQPGQAAGSTPVPATPDVPANPGEQARTITLSDDGATVDLRVGDRFLLKLGEEYDWTVSISDDSVLSRLINVTVVRAAQGIYETHRAGTATVSATGDPACRKTQPPCAAPSRLFQIQIAVK
jgi:carboxyl-terminal processing protease